MARLNDEGAVHMLEAALASVLIVAALFFVNSSMARPSGHTQDGLSTQSSDLLDVLTYRSNSPGHPSLAFMLSSARQWDAGSADLGSDMAAMLPDGVYYYLLTPYGDIGLAPADGMETCSRPFVVYGGAGKMLDCKLVLWRAG